MSGKLELRGCSTTGPRPALESPEKEVQEDQRVRFPKQNPAQLEGTRAFLLPNTSS